MKVLIKNIALFSIALFFTVLFVFSFLTFKAEWISATNIRYKPTCKGKLSERYLEAQSTQKKDILFLGSSHCYRGFDNRIFQEAGYTSFNWGSSSQTPIQSALLLKEFSRRIQPKIIVLEIFPDLYNGNGLESTLDFISNTGSNSISNQMTLSTNDVSAYNTWLYHQMHQLFKNQKTIECDTALEAYIPGGYVEKLQFLQQKKFVPQRIHLTWNEDQLQAIKDIQNMSEVLHSKLIFVLAPMTPEYYAQYNNMDEWLKELESFSDTIINFNPIGADYKSSYFYDPHHLNQEGVEIFNHQLIPILKKEFPL